MGITCRTKCDLPEVNGFKVFSRNEHGQLQTAFRPMLKDGLVYPPNTRIRVDNEEAAFFAFEKFKNAMTIASQGIRKWNFVNSHLIVLPVTLHEVVFKGTFHVQTEDIQCLDGYYPAFEAKEIVIHDTPENRNSFRDSVLEEWFGGKSMSKIVLEAIRDISPNLFNLLSQR